jgi:hypothetical protein
MNRFFLLVGVMILFGCSSNPKRSFPIPGTNDIDEIVRAVIVQDSLSNYKRPLSIDLKKTKVVVIKPVNGLMLPPPIGDLDISGLINTKHRQSYFTKKDSLYILYQNDTLKHFRFNSNLISNLKLTTNAIQEQNEKLDKYQPFLEISIPIFSLDQQYAYIQVNYLCVSCGGGTGIFLKKINKQWMIVKKYSTWRS